MKRLILILSVFIVNLFAKIDINKASIEQLDSLKGIGKKLFEKIKEEIEIKK